MEKIDMKQIELMGSSDKVIFVLKNYGEQTSHDLSTLLQMKKRNVDSLLHRLHKRGKVERVSEGKYKIKE